MASTASPLAAEVTPATAAVNSCSEIAFFGDRMLCMVMNASLGASKTTWQTIAGFLPALLGIVFTFQIIKIIWGMNFEKWLHDFSSTIARAIFGLFVITSSSTYGQLWDLYGAVESASLYIASGGSSTKTYGQEGGNKQMGIFTGFLMNIPHSLHGGMTIERQGTGESKSVLLDCINYRDPQTGGATLVNDFKNNRGLGVKRLNCLAADLQKAAYDENASSRDFVVQVATLTERSETRGGPSALRWGSQTKDGLRDLLNGPRGSISLAEKRQIEDTLYLWNRMDEILNLACAEKKCTAPTTQKNDLSDLDALRSKMENFGNNLKPDSLVKMLIALFTSRLDMASAVWSLGFASFLTAMDYYLLYAAAFVVWVMITLTFLRLVIIPAIVVPFALVFFTAAFVASPVPGHIPQMIGIYKDRFLKYALGPAIMAIIGGMAIALFQAVVNSLVGGM
jgi:hypothetical protein